MFKASVHECKSFLQDQLDQSRVLQQHIEQENSQAKHHILVLQEELSNSQRKCHEFETQIEDYSLASKCVMCCLLPAINRYVHYLSGT
jgi:hypothetical protein